MKREDLTGRVFGRLTVVEYAFTQKTPSGQSKAIWRCRCECGVLIETGSQRLKTGNTNSCGCLQREMTSARSGTHRMTGTPSYESWRAMRERCNNPNNSHYAAYGGRGIKVCASWQASFEAFLADMGERPEGTTLDRINPDGNYEPGNCRWADSKTQALNTTRNVIIEWQGQRRTLTEWASDMGITDSALAIRLERWPLERAMTSKRYAKEKKAA